MKAEVIAQIIERIKVDRNRFTTNARHAHYLGMSVPVYSQIMNGDTEHKLSEPAWRNVAFKLGVDWTQDTGWKIVKTPTFEYVMAQLEACQRRSLSGILCDIPNIGKTVAAKYYAQHNPNVAYIDCSEYKTKDRMLRQIAKEFGIPSSGSYYKVYDQVVFNIRAMERPLVILDEAGDLYHEAYLELKALWNATENCCGWYQMGADGLQKKIERRIDSKRVGYAEIFSRYGDNFKRVTPKEAAECKEFLLHQSRMIAKANAREGQNYEKIARKSGNSGRRVRSLITKPEANE